jgi:2-succinyl-6-hydroxy-2,4-cyclohexadiene-1-carboxylate synthase
MNINGTNINVYEGFSRKGETILFIHPQGSTGGIWKPFFDSFQDTYHVVSMDLRGHGKSEKANSGYDIKTQCSDILALLDALSIQKAHIVGNSLGGDIATAFASLHSERILSLTNIDSGMIDYIGDSGERKLSKEEVLDEFRNRNIKEFSSFNDLYQSVKTIFPTEIWDSYFQEWFKYVSIYELDNGQISYQIPVHINTQIMDMVCDLKYTELYKNIKCPILFLPAVKEDHLEIKLENIKVASQYTRTKVQIIPDSQHLMILNKVNEICHELLAFFIEISEENFIDRI